MDFKMSILFLLLIAQVACTGDLQKLTGEDTIGRKVENISELTTSYSDEQTVVTIYDETVKRIHQFDLATMSYVRLYTPDNQEDKHGLLYPKNGNYVIDFTKKGLTIFSPNGGKVKDPVRLVGNPESAAFRPDLGYLLVVDELKSMALIKLAIHGQVLDSKYLGAKIGNNIGSVRAGDFNGQGELILSTSTDKIVVFDIEKSLKQKEEDENVFTSFDTGLSGISWVAPLRGETAQVLVKTDRKVALIDTVKKSVVHEIDFMDQNIRPVLLSKAVDPHVVFFGDNDSVTVAYVQDNEVKLSTLYIDQRWIYHSQLNITEDSWTLVSRKNPEYDTENNPDDVDYYTVDWWGNNNRRRTSSSKPYGSSNYNRINEYRTDRRLRKFNLSSLRSVQDFKVPDEAKVRLAQSFVFCLFPSELGYATKINIDTEEKGELKLFNLDYIPRY